MVCLYKRENGLKEMKKMKDKITDINVKKLETMKEKKERDIQDEVNAWAVHLGVEPVQAMVRGEKGWPDNMFLIENGFVFFIEYKKPGGVLSPQQKTIRRKLKERGFKVGVYCNVQEGKDFITQTLKSYIDMCGRLDRLDVLEKLEKLEKST